MRATKQVAAELGLTESQLAGLLRRGVIPAPPRLPGSTVYLWSDADVAAAREALERRRQPAPSATPVCAD